MTWATAFNDMPDWEHVVLYVLVLLIVAILALRLPVIGPVLITLLVAWRGKGPQAQGEFPAKPPAGYLSPEEAHARSLTNMRLLIADSETAEMLVSTEGVIEGFNQGAEQLTGWTCEEILQSNLASLVPEPHKHRHHHYIAGYLERREAGDAERILGRTLQAQLERKDGQLIRVELRVAYIDNCWCGFRARLRAMPVGMPASAALAAQNPAA